MTSCDVVVRMGHRVVGEPEVIEPAGLARRAEVELGYSGSRVALGVPGPISHELARIGFEPLGRGEVEAHQAGALERETRKMRERFPGTLAELRWRRTPLAQWTGPVPPPLLAVALLLHRVLPAVVFYVEHLGGDPYLVATTATEEVWVGRWEGVEEERA